MIYSPCSFEQAKAQMYQESLRELQFVFVTVPQQQNPANWQELQNILIVIFK